MSERRSLAQRLVLGLVHAYRAVLKPLLPAACRFEPSCSEYAAQAVARHGALSGGWLALKRLLRCRPGGGGGMDPVPPRCAATAHDPGEPAPPGGAGPG